MAGFSFLKGEIPRFSTIVIFTVSWDFTCLTCNIFGWMLVWKCRDQQGRPTYTTLTDTLFLEQFNKSEIFIDVFYLKYPKINDFLDFCFVLFCFCLFVCFFVFVFNWKVLFSLDFLCFPFHTQIFVIFSVFSISQKIGHSRLGDKSLFLVYSHKTTMYRTETKSCIQYQPFSFKHTQT